MPEGSPPPGIPRTFTRIADEQHLVTDGSRFFKENKIATEQVLGFFQRALKTKEGEPVPNWACFGSYLPDYQKIGSQDQAVIDAYLQRESAGLSTFMQDKLGLTTGNVIIPIHKRDHPNEFEIWMFNLSDEQLRAVQSTMEDLEKSVKTKDHTGFSSTIGLFTSADSQANVIIENARRENGDAAPGVIAQIRHEMVSNRLAREDRLKGDSSEEAHRQRMRLRELFDMGHGMESAKRILNEEIMRGMALDAVGREKDRADKAEEVAIKDALTGVYSRRFFDEAIHQGFVEAERNNGSLTLLMVDGDHFKSVNDQFGHQEGDRVLQEIARVLGDSVRESDTVARYGGEEFAIIMPNMHKLSEADKNTIIDRVNENIRARVMLPNGKPMTISIGVATYPNGQAIGSPTELIGRADAALYQAKEDGRDRAVEFGKDGQFSRVEVSPNA